MRHTMSCAKLGSAKPPTNPRRLVFAVPGELASLTGGYAYARQVMDGLMSRGWALDVLRLDASFPWPTEAALADAHAKLAALPDDTLVLADGLAFGAMPELARQHALRLRWVALVHHPLYLETGLSEVQQAHLFQREKQALGIVKAAITTSPATARALREQGLYAGPLQVALPGTEPTRLARGSAAQPGQGLNLLCVATITPRKGHMVLIEALAGLLPRPWTLHLVGSTTRDAACTLALRQAIQRHQLTSRVHLHGEVSDEALAACHDRADAFVLPSFHEGYGMALADALAWGLPVLSSRVGAIPDTVPDGAGALLAPGDVDGWRAALTRLLTDPAWRASLAQGARQARLHLPTWHDTVSSIEALLACIPLTRAAP